METQPTYQPTLFMTPQEGYRVAQIKPKEAYPFLLYKHYARRIPSVSFAYGLFNSDNLVGVVTYGTPPSSTLCRGICGDDYQHQVLELNRLVLQNNQRNEASRLVAQSLRLLPKPRIIVSFADKEQGHTGYVYQATNFLYTGTSASFRDPKVKGLEHQHHATYAHGLTNKQVIEKYGAENVYFVERSAKHRYITFLGNKLERKKMRELLRYEVLPYPKAEKGKP
jgi:hypothetical protein